MTKLTGGGSLKTSCAIKLLIKQSGKVQSRVNCYEGEIKSYYTLKFGLDHAITNNFLANQLSCRFQSPSLLLRKESLCGDQNIALDPILPPFLGELIKEPKLEQSAERKKSARGILSSGVQLYFEAKYYH